MPRTISVAMIVKDESAHLAGCLAGLSGLADEICIVDTGSQDDTVAIARQYNAKVSFFIWCDDFSAARNESLRACTKEWVFILDADERIASADIPVIRALADNPLNAAYRFTTRNYTNATSVSEFRACPPDDAFARGFSGWYASRKVRLFPNKIGARFEGRVHEVVLKSLEQKNLKIVDCAAPIHHYAFTRPPERLLAKQELYLHLGREKARANPEDPKALAELGNQYAEIHDYPNAAVAYRDSLKIAPANAVVLKDLGGVLHLMRYSQEAKRALKIALQLNPALTEAWRNLGVIYADEKDWALSIECLEQAIETDPAWAEGYHYLSVALAGAGRLADAAAATQKALEANPHSKKALELYVHQMLRLERRGEARRFLMTLVEKDAGGPEMRNVLGELCYYDDLYEEAQKHFRIAGENGISAAYNNLGVVLYKEQKYAEARDAFEKCLAADPGHRGALANLQRTLGHFTEPEKGNRSQHIVGLI